MTDKNLYNELKERGLLYQCTNEEKLKSMLESGKPITVYVGVDPTADSLHIGHCAPYSIMRRFQRAGHHVILLVGGATASIGDPTGKVEMRSMLSYDTIAKNIDTIRRTLPIFIDFNGNNPAVIVNNKEWFDKLSYIDFMRTIGKHFNVNKMVTNEIYANRLSEGGLTFFEMGYMPMQAYDFVHLNKEYGCSLQYGGADQWGNITAGVELQRKLNYEFGTDIELVGATNPLLLTPDGKKMGKTERGAIWIDSSKISAYDFYQGVYQTPDECLRMMFAIFTDIDMKEIDALIARDVVEAKRRLAYEITSFVRGKADADSALAASSAVFAGQGSMEDVPTYEVESLPVNIVDLCVASGLVESKGQARRLIEQGGISVNRVKVSDIAMQIASSDFKDGEMLLQKGKKSYIRITH